MAEPAAKAMTLDELPSRDVGAEMRSGLVGGFPAAMAG